MRKQAEGGPTSGWYGPPRGTHGPGSQGGLVSAVRAKQAEAKRMEPAVTKMVTSAVTDVGGEMAGLAHRLKSASSLRRKIADDAKTKGLSPKDAAAQINDAVRYTALFESDEYFDGVSHVQAALEAQGWKQHDNKWKNFWAPGDQYDGYNTVMVNEKGQRFELQFHTPESFEIKMKIVHPMYEEARGLASGKRKQKLTGLMTAAWTGYERPEGWQKLPGIQVVKR